MNVDWTTPDLDTLKNWHYSLIDSIYTSKIYGGIIYNNNTFATDALSQSAIAITGALCSSLVANGQDLPGSFTWSDVNGNTVLMTAGDMLTLAAQLRQFISNTYTNRQTHIKNIVIASDVSTVTAYDVTTGWPSNSIAPTITYPTTVLAPATPSTPTSGISNGITNILSGGPGGSISGDGGTIHLIGGSSTIGNGGHVYIIGTAGGGPIGNGGNVVVQAGNSAGGTDGTIQFNTGGVSNRFSMNGSGALLISGSAGVAGQFFTSGGPDAAASWTTPGGGSGTVTSVALVEGSTTDIYAISGSPITGAGTLTFTLVTQTANTVFVGPTTGAAAQPTFRTLVAADIPSISLTTGISGILAVANGGSGVNASTGTGSVVLSTSPTLVTPVLGAATGTSLALGGGTALTTTNRTGTGNLVLATSPTLTTPNIGVATGTSLAATGAVSSSGTAGLGYATGAGGTVTQATNRTTGVTLNKICGSITTNTASLAANTAATFTVTNSTVAIGDVIILNKRSGATNVQTSVSVSAVAAGSFNITVFNQNASTAETGAIVINFSVIKAVTA